MSQPESPDERYAPRVEASRPLDEGPFQEPRSTGEEEAQDWPIDQDFGAEHTPSHTDPPVAAEEVDRGSDEGFESQTRA